MPELRSEKTGRGQAQKWFVFRLRDLDVVPSLAAEPGAPQEFTAWRWIDMAELASDTVEFRRGVYRHLQEALGGGRPSP